MESVGEVSMLTVRTAREVFRPPFELSLLVEQINSGGVESRTLTLLTAVFTGMVMAIQFIIGLEPFGASVYTGSLIALGIVRELGPVLTALLVGGRVGAGFAAELGSMAVTEQIDAIRCLGGAFITVLEVGVTPRFIIDQMLDTLGPGDLFHGLFKSVFFGYFIAIMSCWVGMKTRGGTVGVGNATTQAVVFTSVSVLISDFILTRIMLAL
jgi:phospholipid/cholesterol/gamma-HCH transport system permease protein